MLSSSLCSIDIVSCTNLLDFTGQATEQLKPFQEVIGIDPSSVMLDKARASFAHSLKASSTTGTNFKFIQGSAEDLSQTTLQPESVDLITAGTYESQTFESKSYSKHLSLPKSISPICSLVRLEQSLATSTSYTASRRNCCLLGILPIPSESNPLSNHFHLRFMQNFDFQIIPL